MGLTDVLARAAVRRAHVLVVEVPGWWGTRVAVEQAMAARGWRPALSPADADVLLVCGRPGPELRAAVDRVWDQVPGPRTRGAVLDPSHADAALGAAAADLLDHVRQRDDAAARPATDPADDGSAGSDMDHGDMDPSDSEMTDHGDSEMTDHGGMDHGDHGGVDHGGMEMAPGGIPLAGGDEDRDGLEMDVLRVPLGPVLPLWPAGLVLRCTLAGDVVTAAEAEVLGAVDPPAPVGAPSATTAAARRCDAAATVLALAGWEHAAAQARRVRDGLLAGGETAGMARTLLRLRRRVAGSRTLRWSLRGLPAAGQPGDVLDRLLALLDGALADLGVSVTSTPAHAAVAPLAGTGVVPRADTLAVLPDMVTGLEVAAVRLVVASLDLDTASVAPATEVTGG